MIAIPIISLTYILPTLGGLASIGPWEEWTTETGGVGYAAVLTENGYIVRQTPVVHTPVPNQPGGLNTVLRTVAKEGIDIEYMYSILGQRNGLAYMVFRVAEPEKLDAVLSKLG